MDRRVEEVELLAREREGEHEKRTFILLGCGSVG